MFSRCRAGRNLAETDEGTSAPDTSRMMLENADSDGSMVGVRLFLPGCLQSDFSRLCRTSTRGHVALENDPVRFLYVEASRL